MRLVHSSSITVFIVTFSFGTSEKDKKETFRQTQMRSFPSRVADSRLYTFVAVEMWTKFISMVKWAEVTKNGKSILEN